MSHQAGFGAARSRGPSGDATAELIKGASMPIPSTSPGPDSLRSPISALRRAPFMGMRARRMTAGRRHQEVALMDPIAEAAA